jgi:murein tripeptide amidase MpaA
MIRPRGGSRPVRHRWTRVVLTALLLGVAGLPARAQGAAEFLPPVAPWNGKSRRLALPPDHPWATPAEKAGLQRTPTYEETVAWLRRLAQASSDLDLVSIGLSAEGRDIWMVVAAREEPHTPEGLAAAGKPLVLVQAGIHAGEIDGKDAGMMLLRDMTVLESRRHLLDRASLLFIPVLNVDGHERRSVHGRINQRGPAETGWRTNARNLNLNRDYTKLETEEVRAVVSVINRWQPDLYVDLHVTDGLDYQYDVTWGMAPDHTWSPHISRWVGDVLGPEVDRRLVEWGHAPGPFVFPLNGHDLSDGSQVWMPSPRYSDGYGAARHLPTLLVENHSLKPYDRRVLGTYVFLETVLETVGGHARSLRLAAEKDRSRRDARVVLAWSADEGSRREIRKFKGIRSEKVPSPITGTEVVRWTGEPLDEEVVFVHSDVAAAEVDRPDAYYIPAAWSPIAEKLRRHGIEVERLERPTTVEALMYRLPEADLETGGSGFDHRKAVYEGRVRVRPGRVVAEVRDLHLPAGSFRARTDQPLGTLLVLLLEPESPDSLFQWGYFLETLTRTEYAEAYVMEPLARAMLEGDPELAEAFERKLETDPGFAASPTARLDFFYRRTPYYDSTCRLYPIGRSRRPLAAGVHAE